MKSFIIFEGSVIAEVETDLRAGKVVRFSNQKCRDRLKAGRDFSLVNAAKGRISRAVKWSHNKYYHLYQYTEATEINPGEFYIEEC